jgi:hypothetical protein
VSEHWPTQEQFDKAENLGVEYAAAEIAGGSSGPQAGPLSGEWADGLTPVDVARNVGFHDDPAARATDDAEAMSELADAWETGYFSTWQSHLDA